MSNGLGVDPIRRSELDYFLDHPFSDISSLADGEDIVVFMIGSLILSRVRLCSCGAVGERFQGFSRG